MILYCRPFIILPLYTQTKKPKAYFSVLQNTFAHYTFPKHSHLKDCLESPQILLLKHKIVTTLHFHTSAFIIFLEILMHIMPSLMLAERKKIITIKCHFGMLHFKTKDQKQYAFPSLPTLPLSFVEIDLAINWLSYFP